MNREDAKVAKGPLTIFLRVLPCLPPETERMISDKCDALHSSHRRHLSFVIGLHLNALGIYETRLRQNPFSPCQVRVVNELALDGREGAPALLRRVQFF